MHEESVSGDWGTGMLLGKNFDDIDDNTIRSLIESGATESVHLEFKRETYGRADNDKKELLKDISSFANCLGGHLVIGVDEEGGTAKKVSALKVPDFDKEQLRLEQIARSGIEPPIVGLRLKHILVHGGNVIIMHVPRSHISPHRVKFKHSNRYYSRGSSGVYELSMEELRRLFGEQRTIEEQARAFVDQRFLRIQAGDAAMPIPLEKGVIVIHLVPLPDLGAKRRIDIATMKEHSDWFRPMGALSSMYDQINLDGLNISYRGFDQGCLGYTQIFRDGSVEATNTGLIYELGEQRYITTVDLPQKILQSIPAYIKGLRSLEVSPPILMKISFSGLSGVRLRVKELDWVSLVDYKRETLHLPHTILTEYRDNGNYEPLIAEQMDFLWNAFGREKCFFFDKNRNWTGWHKS